MYTRPSAWVAVLICGVDRSDGEGELGERDRHSITGGGVGGEFVVTAAQVLDERVPVATIRSDRSFLDSAHGSEPGLEPAWSASIRLFGYFVVLCRASGSMSSTMRG